MRCLLPALALGACLPGAPDVELGSEAELSRPTGGIHHHATAAWAGDRLAVAWTTGFEPVTGAWFRVFDAEGTASLAPAQLNTVRSLADKPDVVVTPGGYLTAFDDRADGIWLRALAPDGRPTGTEVQLQASTGFEVDAVDLAVQPDGSGVAIWTESGAEWMGPEDGRIVYRGFDASLTPEGPPRILETSSKKTSDASPLPDGGFVAVWARHFDHPRQDQEWIYEVHGRFYYADGTTHSFRADDLDDAWPSRPAVAVRGRDGLLAVSWRDKTSSRGDYAGAYGRVFEPDGTPVGPSIALGPGGDGNRVVTAWAGDSAVFSWQETGDDGLGGVFLSVVDGSTSQILVDRLQVSPSGGVHDARPSIVVREIAGGHEVFVVYETLRPGGEGGDGLRLRSVRLLR